MKKNFFMIAAIIVTVFGIVIYYSGRSSGHAAWSLIVSPVNYSAWELYKPFALSYISFILIELSYLRPSLLRFVCCKLTGLLLLCVVLVSLGIVCGRFLAEWIIPAQLIAAGISVTFVNIVSYRLYYRGVHTEWFSIPLLTALGVMIFLLIILTFYPPRLAVFYDFIQNIYGRTVRW